MRKRIKKYAFEIMVLVVGCMLVTSCSSWRKSKCGECPRWNYVMPY